MFKHHLRERVQFVKDGTVFIVETDEEYRQALILLERAGKKNVEVRLERREDYDGEGFIIEVE